MIRNIVHVAGIIALLSACSTLNDPASVITVDNDKNKVVLVQADKRAIFTFPTRHAYACPEPSPDVKADIDSALKHIAELSAKLPNGVDAGAKEQLEATRKIITAALLQRSQGLQVLRDMLFQACLANLRNDMGPPQYVNFVTNTLPRLTATLITAEMVTRDSGKAVLTGPDLNAFLTFVIGNNASAFLTKPEDFEPTKDASRGEASGPETTKDDAKPKVSISEPKKESPK